jgi:hypothetical protein
MVGALLAFNSSKGMFHQCLSFFIGFQAFGHTPGVSLDIGGNLTSLYAPSVFLDGVHRDLTRHFFQPGYAKFVTSHFNCNKKLEVTNFEPRGKS